MKNRIVIFIFVVEALLCSLFIVQSILYWLHPLRWGWPSEIKQRSLILIVFVFLMLLLNRWLIKNLRIREIAKIIWLFLLLATTLILGLFIILYLPKPPTVDEILVRERYSPQDISKLTACERVDKFTSIGSQKLDLGNRIVLVPSWIHESLVDVPRDILLRCFLEEMLEQESLIANSNGYNEDAIQKLHSLIFEANRLEILSNPEMMERLRIIICEKNIDSFGKLAIEYFIAANDDLPTYDYYSDTGRNKLHKEVCEEKD